MNLYTENLELKKQVARLKKKVCPMAPALLFDTTGLSYGFGNWIVEVVCSYGYSTQVGNFGSQVFSASDINELVTGLNKYFSGIGKFSVSGTDIKLTPECWTESTECTDWSLIIQFNAITITTTTTTTTTTSSTTTTTTTAP